MTDGTIFVLVVWVLATFVPLLYSFLNVRRIRRTYISPQNAPTPLVKDALLLMWSGIMFAFFQTGALLCLCIFLYGENPERVGEGLAAFAMLAPIVGFLVSACQVSWEKEGGRSPRLLLDLKDAYRLFIYSNPVGVAHLTCKVVSRFFLPQRG